MAEPSLPADAVTPLAPTEPAEPLCNCGWRIAACGACGMGYAQRAQQSTPGRVYADVQTFGACSSGPVVRTLDLATSLVTQVQRLDDNGATSQQRTLPVPTPVSDDEPEWEADGTMLQWLNRGTEGSANVQQVLISTPATSVQEELPPGLPVMPGQLTVGQVIEASGVLPSTAARNNAWVRNPPTAGSGVSRSVYATSEAGAPTVPEPNDNAATASLTSLAAPRSRFAGMTLVQQAQACMRRDFADHGAIVRTDTRPPSPTGTNEDLDISPHPRQPGDTNDWNATMATATTETLQTRTTVPAIARGPTPPLSDAGSFVQVPWWNCKQQTRTRRPTLRRHHL